eukprot:gene5784-7982_t
MDYYKILRVSRSASLADIKTAYRKLALEYHPDRNLNKHENQRDEFEEKFKTISQAYEILGNLITKLDYDRSIQNWDVGTAATKSTPFKTKYTPDRPYKTHSAFTRIRYDVKAWNDYHYNDVVFNTAKKRYDDFHSNDANHFQSKSRNNNKYESYSNNSNYQHHKKSMADILRDIEYEYKQKSQQRAANEHYNTNEENYETQKSKQHTAKPNKADDYAKMNLKLRREKRLKETAASRKGDSFSCTIS